MGWDIALTNPDGTRPTVESHMSGSTVQIGGSSEAWMNLTWNYAQHYYKYFPEEMGLRWIGDKKAGDTIDMMEMVLENLGTEFSGDYWEPTPGNAGCSLKILIAWAKQHPEAVWSIV